jgi:exopolysaccharide biosynthesis polyprenyl glycosylphosphotransferase
MYAVRRRVLLNSYKTFDWVVMLFSLIFTYLLISPSSELPSLIELPGLQISLSNLFFVLSALLIWNTAFVYIGLYQSKRLGKKVKEIKDVITATSVGSLLLLLISFLVMFPHNRLKYFLIFWIIVTALTVCSRLLLRRFLSWLRLQGRNLRLVLMVGTNKRALEFADRLLLVPELGYRLIGFVDNQWEGIENFNENGHKLVCDLADFPDYVRKNAVDEVIVALPVKSLYSEASQLVSACEEQGIIVRYLSSIFKCEFPESESDCLGDYSLVRLSHITIYGYQSFLKRLMDIFLASTILIISIPLMIVAAIALKLTSSGTIFFVQDRVGLGKRIFRMYKFRTMVKNAECMQPALEHLNEVCGPVFKIKNDPRITRIGNILRKTSIDELPQLINVVKGDMSIVGPRPLPVRDYEGFSADWHRRRFSVRPGITCLWQVNGRNKIPFDKWMQMDMEYIENWSLGLDAKILLKTIPSVLGRIGAN